MHELAVCQALLEQVSDVAVRRGARSVSRVKVRIGSLSGVEPHLLERAFSVARAGSIAAAAELVIEPEPVRIHCPACRGESGAELNRLRCPTCGHAPVRLISGDALTLTSVTLEHPEASAPSPFAGEETRHV